LVKRVIERRGDLLNKRIAVRCYKVDSRRASRLPPSRDSNPNLLNSILVGVYAITAINAFARPLLTNAIHDDGILASTSFVVTATPLQSYGAVNRTS